MLTYLLIGMIIEGVVILERIARNVAGDLEDWTFGTWMTFLGLVMVNIVIWPITLVSEIYNIKMGI